MSSKKKSNSHSKSSRSNQSKSSGRSNKSSKSHRSNQTTRSVKSTVEPQLTRREKLEQLGLQGRAFENAEQKERSFLFLRLILMLLQATTLLLVVVVMIFWHMGEIDPRKDIKSATLHNYALIVEGALSIGVMICCFIGPLFMRYVLSLLYISAITYGVYSTQAAAIDAINNKNDRWTCNEDGSNCEILHTISISHFHLIYMCTLTFIHLILFLFSIALIIVYSGSTSHYIRLRRNVFNKRRPLTVPPPYIPPNCSHQSKSSSCYSAASTRHIRPGTHTTVSMSAASSTYHTPGGELLAHGTGSRTSVLTIVKTPTECYVEEVTTAKTRVAMDDGKKGNQKLPRTPTGSSTRKITNAVDDSYKIKPKTPGVTRRALPKNDSTLESSAFNNVSKMPALVSPIAYLNRTETAPPSKPSNYAF